MQYEWAASRPWRHRIARFRGRYPDRRTDAAMLRSRSMRGWIESKLPDLSTLWKNPRDLGRVSGGMLPGSLPGGRDMPRHTR